MKKQHDQVNMEATADFQVTDQHIDRHLFLRIFLFISLRNLIK